MSEKPIKLSVLDIGPIRSNQTMSDCLSSMVSLAKVADDLWYDRYWLAEHHNVAAVAASQTPVLASVIGANTNNIRIGGCVLLSHYTPLLVAEQMAIVEASFPGRVDLGLGRSNGADWTTSSALRGRRDQQEDNYPNQVFELLQLMNPQGVQIDKEESPYFLKAAPNAASVADRWVLGTSSYSAQVAAHFGLPFAYGYHIRAEGAKEAIDTYRENFKPSQFCLEPRVLVSGIVVVGRTMDEAELLARPQLYFMSGFRSGEPVSAQMLVEDGAVIQFPERYTPLVNNFRNSWIIGDPGYASSRIAELCHELGVDEFMVNPIAAAYQGDPTDRAPNREFALRSLKEKIG